MNFDIGSVGVVIGKRVITPEEQAEKIVSRIIHISETAAPEIREPAMVFRDVITKLIADGISAAIEHDRLQRK